MSRHRFGWGAVVAVVSLVAAFAGPSAALGRGATPSAGEWPQFGHDLAHSGYNADESTIGLGNLSDLGPAWTGTGAGFIGLSSPAVAGGVVYLGVADGNLYAFDAAGATNCSGTPKVCQPMWTGPIGGATSSSPAVANGVVYVGSPDHKLYAFDASGTTNCSGAPKVCQPLWTGSTGDVIQSSPAVANGVVYVGSFDTNLYAFDAAGATNCSGAPKVCQPLWTGHTGGNVFSPIRSSPAVANGVVYAGSDRGLYAFDAAGVTNCSGTPKVCQPLWSWNGGTTIVASASVANGVAYLGSQDHKLYAFDASGTTNCSGNPKVCHPLWTGSTGDAIQSSPAVASGVVYQGSIDNKLYAFDAAGTTNCSGNPKVCQPLWTGSTGDDIQSSPAVANGVVYVPSRDNVLYAFDAAGTTNCSGAPKMCQPVWVSPTTGGGVVSSPAVSNGVVYAGLAGKLFAFALGVSSVITDVSPASSYTVSGTVGNDAITVRDGPIASGFRTVEVVVGTVTYDLANKSTITVQAGDGADSLTVDNPTKADGVNAIVVNGQGGSDTADVHATAPGVQYSVDVRTGVSDAVEVGSSLDQISGPLTLRGSAGSSATLDDSADTTGDAAAWSFAPSTGLTTLSGASPAAIRLRGFPTVATSLGSGGDTLKVTGTDPSASTTFDLGPGNDVLALVGSASITSTCPCPVQGGSGTDALSYAGYTSGATADLGTGQATGVPAGVAGFENLTGSNHADTLSGNGGANVLTGRDGDDGLMGAAGTDTLVGGPGSDTLQGGDDNDVLKAKDNVSGNDTADGGAGTDVCAADPGDVVVNCE